MKINRIQNNPIIKQYVGMRLDYFYSYVSIRIGEDSLGYKCIFYKCSADGFSEEKKISHLIEKEDKIRIIIS